MNSSLPLIFRKFQGFGGIWASSEKFGKFQETQGNSVQFSGVLCGVEYEFSGNSWGISRFRENLGFGWFRAIWGLERLCANSHRLSPLAKQINPSPKKTAFMDTLLKVGVQFSPGSRPREIIVICDDGPRILFLFCPDPPIPFFF